MKIVLVNVAVFLLMAVLVFACDPQPRPVCDQSQHGAVDARGIATGPTGPACP